MMEEPRQSFNSNNTAAEQHYPMPLVPPASSRPPLSSSTSRRSSVRRSRVEESPWTKPESIRRDSGLLPDGAESANHLTSTVGYVRLVEMGFEAIMAERALLQAIQQTTNTHVVADAANMSRASPLMNDALDILLVWGCVPNALEMVVHFVLETAVTAAHSSTAAVFTREHQSITAAGVQPRISLRLRPNYPLEFVKRRIAETERVFSHHMYFALQNTALTVDTKTLADYGLTNGRTIRVILSNEGPPPLCALLHRWDLPDASQQQQQQQQPQQEAAAAIERKRSMRNDTSSSNTDGITAASASLTSSYHGSSHHSNSHHSNSHHSNSRTTSRSNSIAA
jgi:hypothetical protein